ncbi:MAG: ATP-dependent RNA helicase HrpA [Pseudomonadales bacterium]|nr:ATP-dependent RNA helicase HrpA [Pseudomonadales bacterium]
MTEVRKIISELDLQLENCMSRDRFRLGKSIGKLKRSLEKGKERNKTDQDKQRNADELERLQQRITGSVAKAQYRADLKPVLDFPAQLPISERREEIVEAIKNNQVVILAGETGSGKTTQLPKLCIEAGRGVFGTIGHTQPRRLAARSVASRIAEEMKVTLGNEVGYQVRFSDKTSDNTLVKLMTDGILLAETQYDRFLNQYDTIIIDEAHERSLNIDFLLGYLKQILPKRPDLKVIVTSATIDLDKFSNHFNSAPIIEVSGRTFPVEVLYRPVLDDDESDDTDLSAQVVAALDEIQHFESQKRKSGGAASPQDVLIFLSGEREIRELANDLRKREMRDTEILPLYARLSAKDQARIFQSHRGRRLILATNVAETSLTVPGIGYVIDPGFARISRYSYRTKVQRLPIEPISQASANQRKGRCGRVADGICIRLYSESDFLSRAEFTDAEIQRTNLASVILQMLSLRLGDIEKFPFIDAPDPRLIRDGFRLLEELDAITKSGQVTDIGRQMSRIPVDPRLGRMLIAGVAEGCLSEMQIIASALSLQDPRERPAAKRQAADQAHERYRDASSDFVGFINLWKHIEEKRDELSNNQFRRYCQKQFLSWTRINEWRELHRQLHLISKELNYKENRSDAGYDPIHRSVLQGYLSNIGTLDEEKQYLGTRNRRFLPFPTSALAKKKSKWVVATELVETSRLFAHTVAKIEPEWIEPIAGDRVKRNYSEPHWEKNRGQVVAFEQVTLYGLVIVAKRKVDFGRNDMEASRAIFIQSALVEQQLNSKAAFITHNQNLIAQLEGLEDKSRSRDILVEPEKQFEFYDERIPADIYDQRSFEKWLKVRTKQEPKLLFMEQQTLLKDDAREVDREKYPDRYEFDGLSFPLTYCFDPGDPRDGVTIQVPVAALRQLPEYQLQWLVPGLLREKCIALVKNLPKPIRKNFVPVPDYVDAVLQTMWPVNEPLTRVLGDKLKRKTGVVIDKNDWNLDGLDKHLQMNFEVYSSDNKLLCEGRDFAELLMKVNDQPVSDQSSKGIGVNAIAQSGLKNWQFGQLPQQIEHEQEFGKVRAYPALVDQGDTVDIQLFETLAEAQQKQRHGVVRMIYLAIPQQIKYLKKLIKPDSATVLHYASFTNQEQLKKQIIDAVLQETFLQDKPLPYEQNEFEKLIEQGRSELVPNAEKLMKLIADIAPLYQQTMTLFAKQRSAPQAKSWQHNFDDIQHQLDALMFDNFLTETPPQWLARYPVYLKALQQRLDKLPAQVAKDLQISKLMGGYYKKCVTLEGGFMSADNRIAYDHFRWMLEEFRVSQFAQTLGTALPVSEKRLDKQLKKIENSS